MSRLPLAVRAELPNLGRIKRLCRTNALLAGIWRDAMTDSAEFVEGRMRARVPTGTTRALESSVSYAVSAQPVPMLAIIAADATGANGFRYGWALQASKRIPYRYRGKFPGRKALRWASAALKSKASRAKINEILGRAARRIEGRWRV
jgi:hypothetical protein